MSSMRSKVAFFSCIAVLLAATCRAEVVMVYSVGRHGARNVLPKGSLLTESDANGGPTLLPEGQRQAWEAGAGFRERYLSQETCSGTGTCLAGDGRERYGVVNAPDVGFSNYNLLVRSSGLDRTIMTALSFWDGALPPAPNNATEDRFLPDGEQVVPVYTRADSEDTLIRAYAKCKAYQSRLTAWFAGEEFKQKEAESEPFRAGIQAKGVTDASLKSWWNVYDSFTVYRDYGVGNPMPALSDAEYESMQTLAYWLEAAKMRSNLTGSLLAGPLLADLLEYMTNATRAVDGGFPIYYKLLHLSGHYNTMLGVLGALELDKYPPAANFTWLRTIPELAALMAFELHASQSKPPKYAVRLVSQDGPGASYVTVPLPCSEAGGAAESIVGEQGACSLEAFNTYVSSRALNATQWCTSCQDSSTAFCKLTNTTAQLAATQAQLAAVEGSTPIAATGRGAESGEGGGGSGSESWKIAVSVCVTFVGTAVLASALTYVLMKERLSRSWARPLSMQMGEVSDKA